LGEEATSIYERIIKLCIQAHQHERALRVFSEAQGKHADLARRLSYPLAKVYLAQGQPAKALGHLDGYLKTQHQGIEAYDLSSTMLTQLGRADDILPALEKY